MAEGPSVVLYLAEQYWPDLRHDGLRTALAALLADRDGPDTAARVVAILFTPHDECVFYVLEGQSETAAGELVAQTGRPADRVQRCERMDTAADALHNSQPGHR